VPLPFITRFVDDRAVEDSLSLLYGSDDWMEARQVQASTRIRLLRTKFEEAVRTHSTYVRSFDIRPDGNRGYSLFFGTRHLLGLERMKAVMWSVDPAGGCLYADTTDPRQEVLFGPQPDYRQLGYMLQAQFGSNTFSIEEAERFVLVETPFAKSHLKTPILKPAEAAGQLAVVESSASRHFPGGDSYAVRPLTPDGICRQISPSRDGGVASGLAPPHCLK